MSDLGLNQNWRQLAIVQVGGSICLPVLMVGQTLAQLYPGLSTVITILVGNLILFALACVTALAGAKQKKSTAEFAIELFGDRGKFFFIGAMVVSMIGWFAIQLQLMGLCLQEGLQSLGISMQLPVGNLILGSFIGLVGIRGLKGVTWLAKVISPLLALTIVYALTQPATAEMPLTTLSALNFSGISLVVAGSIAAVIDLPTFFRESRSSKDALKAAFILFCVTLPLVEGAGAFLAMQHQGGNLVTLLQGLSDNPFWRGWILVFLILAGWTTNNANMYSASVSLGQLFVRVKAKKCIVLVCFLGTALSCFPLLQNLEVFIGAIGVILSSMGAVMISHFMANREAATGRECFVNLFSVACGTGIGIAALSEMINFSGIPILEAFFGALIIQMIDKLFNLESFYETNRS